MKMKKVKTRISYNNLEEWIIVRECFVKSFFHYPLYVYFAPNPSIRGEFLKLYFDANFEVIVGGKNGLLFYHYIVDVDGQIEIPVGGTIFLYPSSKGGWKQIDDKTYWRAYMQYGLHKLDKNAYRRLIEYESWECRTISSNLSKTKSPQWNGLFAAIDLEFAGTGCGSDVSKQIYSFFQHVSSGRTRHVQLNDRRSLEDIMKRSTWEKTRFRKMFDLNCLYSAFKNRNTNMMRCSWLWTRNCGMIGISHHARAVSFYVKNGADVILKLPYPTTNRPDVAQFQPFYVYVVHQDLNSIRC